MSTAPYKKPTATAEDYRTPMQVAHLHRYRDTDYCICPRCNTTMEREFMHYCDRCGQCLCWKDYKKVVIIRE